MIQDIISFQREIYQAFGDQTEPSPMAEAGMLSSVIYPWAFSSVRPIP